MEIKKYEEYVPGKKCCVEGCDKPADFEVYLYDYYPPPLNEEFFQQDYTCPFLCEEHMEKNETAAIGTKRARGIVNYPHTNKHNAQGYTKYAPIPEVYPKFYSAESQLILPQAGIIFNDVNQELIKYLAKHPDLLREVDPRKFEEIVAELFKDMGFDVELTPPTRDGGKDIYAIKESSIGRLLYIVECKRYQKTKKVGIEVVRGLYGVKQAERATMGIIATTSSFTKDAIDFANPLQYELSLKNFEELKAWLNAYQGV